MYAGPRLRKPISSQYTDHKASWVGAGPGQESRGSRPNLPANRWLPRSHTATRLPAMLEQEWAAHSEVGEGARAEVEHDEMIVIEYEMSITWNEHAIQAGRGSED